MGWPICSKECLKDIIVLDCCIFLSKFAWFWYCIWKESILVYISPARKCNTWLMSIVYMIGFRNKIKVVPWCSGYHYCTTSFNKAWTQVLCRLKSCLWCVRDSWWWGSLTIVPAGNKAKCLSSVNHTTKTIHHIFIIIKQVFWYCCYFDFIKGTLFPKPAVEFKTFKT